MSHPTCSGSASLDRCDRYDLLVDLEGFHLMSVAHTPRALVLDIESYQQLAAYAGCRAITQGHGCVVVELIDPPWAGVAVRIRWFKRRWTCHEHTCQIATFIKQNHSVCAPRARLGVRAIRSTIRQLRFEGAGGVWVFRTVCFERVVLSSPGCLWPGRMDDHEEVLEAHA